MSARDDTPCLAAEQVAAFVAGQLDAGTVERVDEHVAGCEECLRRVAHAAWQLVPQLSETLHAVGSAEALDTSESMFSARLAELFAANQARAIEMGDSLAGISTQPARVLGGRFEVSSLIAQGAMGSVYHGRDRQTGQAVAIKRLKSEIVAENPEFLARFQVEGEILGRLDHPNIVKMLAALPEAGERYIVMEYVAGGSLRDALRAQGKLPLSRVLAICLELCDALARAHHLKIIHRDIKPENVLLAQDGTPRLSDFGLARAQGQGLTARGEVMGTMAYLSPEALWGRVLDERADVWALGVTLYEMARGQHPFWGENPGATLTAILQHPLPDLETEWPEAPIALVDLLYRMLEKNPDQRIPSMRRVGAELEAILRELDGGPGSLGRAGARSAPLTPGSRPMSRGSGPPSSDGLPAPATPFVGRERELSEIATLLAAPETRLLTILGPGGMGKSRLALQAARQAATEGGGQGRADGAQAAGDFPDGVYFVDLGALRAPEQLVPALAEAVLYRFYPGVEPWRQLLDYFREKRLLLLLDNFESVLGAAGSLGELLRVAPNVKVLATSRERLGISAETRFILGGLRAPLPDVAQRVDAVVDREHYSALSLFQQTARRVEPSFELDAEALPHVASICGLVQGLPLGIVLAASWAGVLSVSEIEQEIVKGLDFLRTDLSDVPERQQSLRAVFEHSVRLLSPEARALFARISVFRGGFTRAAAETVAGAQLRSLAELMNKSLLVREPQNGRYVVHDLLQSYARDQLAADAEALREVGARHAAYQVQFLCDRQPALQGLRQRRALQEIDVDLANVRAGFQWLLEHRDVEAAGRALEPLCMFYHRRSVAEGQSVCASVVAAFGELSAPGGATAEAGTEQASLRRVVGLALAWQGFFSAERGQHENTQQLLGRALSLLDNTGHSRELAFALVTAAFSSRGTITPEQMMAMVKRGLELYRRADDRWGLARALMLSARATMHVLGDNAGAEVQFREAVALQESFGDRAVVLPLTLAGLGQSRMLQGHQREALGMISEALASAERFDDPWSVISCLNALALTRRSLGDYEAAEAAARRGLAMCREFGCSRVEAWGCLMLGDALKEQGRYEEALESYHTSLARGAGDAVIAASVSVELGNIALLQRRHSEARPHLLASLAGFEALRNNWGSLIALDGLGSVACAEGDLAAADGYFRRALDLGLRSKSTTLMLNALTGFALARARAGEALRAVELLGFIENQSATEHATRVRRLEPLLRELRGKLHPDEFGAAFERGKARTLEASLWA